MKSYNRLLPLVNRCIIEIKGEDAVAYLQGLTTNNLSHLYGKDSSDYSALYTAFLTPQGRFLDDAFIFRKNTDDLSSEVLWLDVERENSEDLLKRLFMYRLRSKVDLCLKTDICVYVSFEDSDGLSFDKIVRDPRDPSLGYRIYGDANVETAPEASPSDALPFDAFLATAYKNLCIQALAPDCARVIQRQRGFIIDYGFNHLNAIDFNKGCYMGQELTARMFHTNLSKKELCYFAWKDILEADVFGCEMQDYANYIGAVLYYNGEECGKIVDATKDYVLALILSEIHLNGIKGGVIEGVHKEIIHFNDKKFSLKQDNGPLEFTICKITIRKY